MAMILTFPQRLDGAAWFSSLIKITKFGSGAIGAPMILILAAILIWGRTARRTANVSN
jgi:hypothetical protein